MRRKGWERVSSRRGCGGLGGRPSSPRRGKPFRSGVDPNNARTHPHQNLYISTGLSVDRQGITMHPFLGNVFWSGMLPFFFPGCLGWRRVFLGWQQEPPRAPAVGREETHSRPILQAPSPATDKKRIYRLFSALPGNNRSQKEVFLVQLGCAGENFAITPSFLPQKPPALSFIINPACLLAHFPSIK